MDIKKKNNILANSKCKKVTCKKEEKIRLRNSKSYYKKSKKGLKGSKTISKKLSKKTRKNKIKIVIKKNSVRKKIGIKNNKNRIQIMDGGKWSLVNSISFVNGYINKIKAMNMIINHNSLSNRDSTSISGSSLKIKQLTSLLVPDTINPFIVVNKLKGKEYTETIILKTDLTIKSYNFFNIPTKYWSILDNIFSTTVLGRDEVIKDDYLDGWIPKNTIGYSRFNILREYAGDHAYSEMNSILRETVENCNPDNIIKDITLKFAKQKNKTLSDDIIKKNIFLERCNSLLNLLKLYKSKSVPMSESTTSLIRCVGYDTLQFWLKENNAPAEWESQYMRSLELDNFDTNETNQKYELVKKIKGWKVIDSAFLSTAVRQHDHFCTGDKERVGCGPIIIMNIKLAPNIPGIFTTSIGEREILLPPGCVITITNIQQVTKSVWDNITNQIPIDCEITWDKNVFYDQINKVQIAKYTTQGPSEPLPPRPPVSVQPPNINLQNNNGNSILKESFVKNWLSDNNNFDKFQKEKLPPVVKKIKERFEGTQNNNEKIEKELIKGIQNEIYNTNQGSILKWEEEAQDKLEDVIGIINKIKSLNIEHFKGCIEAGDINCLNTFKNWVDKFKEYSKYYPEHIKTPEGSIIFTICMKMIELFTDWSFYFINQPDPDTLNYFYNKYIRCFEINETVIVDYNKSKEFLESSISIIVFDIEDKVYTEGKIEEIYNNKSCLIRNEVKSFYIDDFNDIIIKELPFIGEYFNTSLDRGEGGWLSCVIKPKKNQVDEFDIYVNDQSSNTITLEDIFDPKLVRYLKPHTSVLNLKLGKIIRKETENQYKIEIDSKSYTYYTEDIINVLDKTITPSSEVQFDDNVIIKNLPFNGEYFNTSLDRAEGEWLSCVIKPKQNKVDEFDIYENDQFINTITFEDIFDPKLVRYLKPNIVKGSKYIVKGRDLESKWVLFNSSGEISIPEDNISIFNINDYVFVKSVNETVKSVNETGMEIYYSSDYVFGRIIEIDDNKNYGIYYYNGLEYKTNFINAEYIYRVDKTSNQTWNDYQNMVDNYSSYVDTQYITNFYGKYITYKNILITLFKYNNNSFVNESIIYYTFNSNNFKYLNDGDHKYLLGTVEGRLTDPSYNWSLKFIEELMQIKENYITKIEKTNKAEECVNINDYVFEYLQTKLNTEDYKIIEQKGGYLFDTLKRIEQYFYRLLVQYMSVRIFEIEAPAPECTDIKKCINIINTQNSKYISSEFITQLYGIDNNNGIGLIDKNSFKTTIIDDPGNNPSNYYYSIIYYDILEYLDYKQNIINLNTYINKCSINNFLFTKDDLYMNYYNNIKKDPKYIYYFSKKAWIKDYEEDVINYNNFNSTIDIFVKSLNDEIEKVDINPNGINCSEKIIFEGDIIVNLDDNTKFYKILGIGEDGKYQIKRTELNCYCILIFWDPIQNIWVTTINTNITDKTVEQIDFKGQEFYKIKHKITVGNKITLKDEVKGDWRSFTIINIQPNIHGGTIVTGMGNFDLKDLKFGENFMFE
jgi:hypothetical protein